MRTTFFSKFIPLFGILISIDLCTNAQLLQKMKEKIKETADQRAQDKAVKSANQTVDKVDSLSNNIGKQIFKKKTKTVSPSDNNSPNSNNRTTSNTNTSSSTENNATSIQSNGATTITTETAPQLMQAYQNYDFVAGDQIIFADDFTTDQLGEFPSHWGLITGQGTVNKSGDKTVFNILNGNYAVVKPLLKSKEYLDDAFTVEFDYFVNSGDDCGYGVYVWMTDPEGNDTKGILLGRYKMASTSNLSSIEGSNDLEGTPSQLSDEEFYNHWHHFAIAYKKPQIKVYIDQTRSLVVPNLGFTPKALKFGGGAGDEKCPITITNVRVANGGSQNMLSSIFGKGNVFTTHGITFEIDKAAIKPESMGVLNELVEYLKQNPSVKMEIDGHTDNSGNAAHNLTLSQQRADAVKMQLANMGIDASRLSTKGFGSTKPIGTNDTPEGKANNRRVEFVKL